jgi:hypothetical protein
MIFKYEICDSCETVAHCSNHGCVPITAAEAHHSDKGYSLGNQQDYEAFVAKRNQLSGPSGPPPPSYQELLQEVWYLRRRVKTLEQQNLEYSWQLYPESMGR